MITIQKKNTAYAQVLEILNYMKIEDYFKIPRELICALEANKDKDSDFKYNREKDFLEQNVSAEAKLILAIFFKRYWATDEQLSNKVIEEKLEEKRQNQLATIKEHNWFKRLLIKIRKKFSVRE